MTLVEVSGGTDAIRLHILFMKTIDHSNINAKFIITAQICKSNDTENEKATYTTTPQFWEGIIAYIHT